MKRIFLLEKDFVENRRRECATLQHEMEAAAEFVHQIKAGNLGAGYAGATGDHHLARALLALRDQMSVLLDQEVKRNWTNEGLARFSELLRAHELHDLKAWLNKVLSNLIDYLGANQGAVFILNDADPTHRSLELMACYAYGRLKHRCGNLDLGEGLAGQCFLEQKPIYMTDVPGDYLRITSGLGEALPRNILIMPLMRNENALGVVELASFRTFETHQIDFVAKIGEGLAAAYLGFRTRQETNALLKESQLQAEQLKAQEEEMRQNMEEMQATQEELKRIQMESEAQTGIINRVAIVSKTDVRGNITYVNEEFTKWSKYAREEVIGKNHRFLKSGHQPDEVFVDLWKTISSGRIWRGEVKNRAKDGTYYWVDAIIAPVLDEHGKPKEYIAQRFVINEKKEQEEQLRKLLAEAKSQATTSPA